MPLHTKMGGSSALFDAGRAQARSLFFWTLGVTWLLKLFLSLVFPMTGDEAFFLQWGIRPDWGYSDHPPMVGWWLAVLHAMGDAPGVLRLFTVAVTSVVAWLVVDTVRGYVPPDQEAAAWWAGSVYLVLPWSWMFVLVTTDTPLVFWLTVSAWCFLRAERSPSRQAVLWVGGAGLSLGLAFLSKYFAALLGMSYAVYVLGWRRDRWWALPLLLLGALPSIALNLGFNLTHGWPNIMFNLLNRNAGAHWQWQTVLVYVGMMLYLLTPWLVWQVGRHSQRASSSAGARLTGVLWAWPLCVFGLLSLGRSIGLHWVLGFVPWFVVWAALRAPGLPWARVWRWTVGLSTVHAMLLALLLWLPVAYWSGAWRDKVVFLRHADEVVQALEADLPTGAHLMAYAYSPAAVLAYYHRQYVPVYGVGRHHARQDDLQVDFRAWDGASVRVLMRDPVDVSQHAAFFDTVRTWTFERHGITYHVLDGQGFHYPVYRERVLAEIARRFHAVPALLPQWGHPFCERYGFTDCVAPAHRDRSVQGG